ncbi:MULTISPECIES: hypothetical protein [Leeuwenhoekiella]|uniref:Uncharacterized protein n=1 Tax=Leeuwenhoekiella blandensis (strain CECT 7118 / CCUG 51940 / KCTC 22103 / MED217) TaxID=398720 RepID=A3XHQ1_LEEBM|nr:MULTISPECIES: hypothetical protein [Leeuwenhoekiella]EAQ51191.1 hypothetical protein MED217_16650 [Leeuwenhoekiella blandensis MED217]MAO42380.1 hypothetical protein [Leeuwenhoekiella sp.]HBT11447.1 hypothetical protein [Leeuwenhoekiella sp.]HCW64847.1 hypothetical protein [Leeuwenhoekiella sp.]|tara:strand:- start:3274 stop:3819 length:546 start_codon:yes stop_codon:yes gene_type:complete
MIYFFIYFNMMFINTPEALIGKNLKTLKHYEEVETSDENIKSGIRRFRSEDELFFLDEKIEEFHCEVDTDSKIISVKFRIKEAILQMNYRNKFIDVFGEPDASFCIGEIAKSSETKLSNGAVSSSAVIIPKKCDFFDNSVLATVWKLDNNVFLEFTHPQSRSTFPRAYINITKSSKWVEMK